MTHPTLADDFEKFAYSYYGKDYIRACLKQDCVGNSFLGLMFEEDPDFQVELGAEDSETER